MLVLLLLLRMCRPGVMCASCLQASQCTHAEHAGDFESPSRPTVKGQCEAVPLQAGGMLAATAHCSFWWSVERALQGRVTYVVIKNFPAGVTHRASSPAG